MKRDKVLILAFYCTFLSGCNAGNSCLDESKIDRIVNRQLKASWQYESLKYNRNTFSDRRLNESYVDSVYNKNAPNYQRAMYDYFYELKSKGLLKSNIKETVSFLKKESCKKDNHFNRCIYLLNKVKDNYAISNMIYKGNNWSDISSGFFNDKKNNETKILLKNMLLEYYSNNVLVK
ncbi:hypothetical protein M8D54_004964 [Salmonella enterica]|nr:hypothetical protein [Salmonella enterica]EGR6194422.1 hypothetical protein [Salmonella enterica]EHR7428490.1 hypothetical protein [Salmonella enterica]EJF2005546.1 hypothetical protein [Salmonella enterica]EJF2493118.1 hypothetical protein [Salmonella enterica]